MKRATFFGAFVALLSAGSAHAVQAYASAETCMTGGKTYMCSKATTSLNVLEALVYHSGEIEVRGVFNGPGYQAELEASSGVLAYWSPSWTTHVEMQKVCAWSGVSSAEGVHRAWTGTEIPILLFSAESLDFHVQFACNCGSEIP